MSEPIELVSVGEKEYRVIKTGRAQAEQTLALSKWFSKHGLKALREITAEKGELSADNGIEFLGMLLDHLSVDALIDLFQAVVGCPKEDAELYFDVATLVEVVIELFNRQPAIRRLVDRFFSAPSSTPVSEESSTN